MNPALLAVLAWGDFRDRVRRPAYAVTLLAAILLGYLAVPAADSHWAIVQLGSYRGLYNSAYVGTATALASTLWLLLGGFYVVRNTIARDESTNVGQLLAATPLRTTAYLAAKFFSNVLVLSSMLVVLAVTALVMQLARGESTSVDPVALLLPFAVMAFPVVVLTASAALFFELTPVLKTGAGNVIWFFCWLVAALAGQSPRAPLGGLGVPVVVESIGTEMLARGLDVTGGEFSLGLTYLDEPLVPFEWLGFTPSAEFLLTRLALIGIGLAVALLPVLWFGRFDPARVNRFLPRRPVAPPAWSDDEHRAPGVPSIAVLEGGAFSTRGGPRTAVVRGGALVVFPRLVVGELHILVQGVSKWWWAGTGFWTALTFAATVPGLSRLMLPLAWIWPVLLWSRLGTQRHESGVQALLGPYPGVRMRVVAEWIAGVLLTAGVGGAVAVRMAWVGDLTGLASWGAAALFIPSLALLLGSLSRTHRVFQAVYVPLWYGGFSGLPLLDFMGVLRGRDGSLLGVPPDVVATAGVALVTVVVLLAARRPLRA
ncbi:ABC-2 transporter permease [Umezawaea beigongshangensis]|uniref:ABC-2 transporter permease n=1 Tax=Umezawaea beigongshangensis TaxID=2780383 RepID=UPI0018F172FB|nr:ABC-2 transporter permease [Umezawaea beigongshangensis]